MQNIWELRADETETTATLAKPPSVSSLPMAESSFSRVVSWIHFTEGGSRDSTSKTDSDPPVTTGDDARKYRLCADQTKAVPFWHADVAFVWSRQRQRKRPKWNASRICCIYLTYPSGKELKPIANVWQRLGPCLRSGSVKFYIYLLICLFHNQVNPFGLITWKRQRGKHLFCPQIPLLLLHFAKRSISWAPSLYASLFTWRCQLLLQLF